MNNNPFNLVKFWTLHTIDTKFSGVGNSIDKFLMLISSFIKFESFQVCDQYLWTRLDLYFFDTNLFSETFFTLKFV